VVSIDHWNGHKGIAGKLMREITWKPPPEIAKDNDLMKATPPPLFWQWVRNVNESGYRGLIQPLPLWEESRATQLGANVTRPKLVYVNPPRHAPMLRHDIVQGWRLLACGGSLAGAGYHLPTVRPVVDAFARHLSERQPRLETHVVHAPGASKYERIDDAYSDAAMIANKKTNFSTWAFRGKRCGGDGLGGAGGEEEVVAIEHDEVRVRH